jgi:hypothetical protein
MLTLNKVEETPKDYETFKPVKNQIYVLEDLIDAMKTALSGKEAVPE